MIIFIFAVNLFAGRCTRHEEKRLSLSLSIFLTARWAARSGVTVSAVNRALLPGGKSGNRAGAFPRGGILLAYAGAKDQWKSLRRFDNSRRGAPNEKSTVRSFKFQPYKEQVRGVGCPEEVGPGRSAPATTVLLAVARKCCPDSIRAVHHVDPIEVFQFHDLCFCFLFYCLFFFPWESCSHDGKKLLYLWLCWTSHESQLFIIMGTVPYDCCILFFGSKDV